MLDIFAGLTLLTRPFCHRLFLIAWLAPLTEALAGPTGATVVSGDASVSYGSTTTINQSTSQVVIDWASFSIPSGEQVNFVQPSSSAIALNRDMSGTASDIMGNLSANGQVYLFNSAGILIGPGASINVGGFLASDMSVTSLTVDEINERMSLVLNDPDQQQGGVRIEGAVTTSTRSGVTLIAQFIENSGTITAQNGDVNLAVANGPIVVTSANGTMGVEISDGVRQDISPDAVLIDNSGSISAVNGNIHINVQYLSNLNLQAVRNTGLVNAVGIGYGEITQHIVLQAPPATDDLIGPGTVVSDAIALEVDLDTDSLVADSPQELITGLDRLMTDCIESDSDDKDCARQRALKHYLGRLLIGGDLPD